MLASICPLGERARRQRYPVTVTAYAVASTAAGCATGAALGAIGRAVLPAGARSGDVALAALATAAAAGLLADRAAAGHHLPGPRRQVNEDWLTRYRGWVYGAGFGAQLGAGVATYVTVSAIYVVLAGALLAGSLPAGALVGATFGLARALPVLATAGVHDPSALRHRLRELQRALPLAHRTVLGAQAAVVLAAGAMVLGVA
jgi:hypothetical protein